ncbi:beta-ketoacyl synthase N-terminal-like domain-containing protein [Motilimonas cestriensis]|uniref:beta-ketoacyl synthase N-terminal-like domain-containing protein n=1 Tax=Motilimonas cestriensis TaxID=2742685 RepID=UPI003DA21C03
MSEIDRIVISGIGALTPLGADINEHLAAHQQGESCLRAKHELPFLQGDVSESNIKQWIPDKKSCRMLTRQGLLGIASATLALNQAQLSTSELAEQDQLNGVIYGAFYSQGVLNAAQPYLNALDNSDTIDYQAFGDRHYREFPPLWILPRLPNTTGGQISIQYGLRGLSYSVVNGPAGGMISVGEALECIQDGRARRFVTGASEMDPTIEQLFALDQLGVLAKQTPSKAGLTISEAGVSFIVEPLALAQSRQVSNSIELVAYENSYIPHILTLSEAELEQKVRAHFLRTLDKAELSPQEISAIQLTMAGIPALDQSEAKATQQVFSATVPVLCATDYSGFALGAAAATNLFYACLQLQHQYLAPVLNQAKKPLIGQLNYQQKCQLDAGITTLFCHHIDHLGNQVSLILRTTAHHRAPHLKQELI